jgi:hypothetical protein
MKEGTRVLYVDSKGETHAATVTRVRGAGPSLRKRVDLEVEDMGGREDVAHVEDAKGSTCWREAPTASDGLTDAERATLTPAAPPAPPVVGMNYVYDAEPAAGGAQRSPGLGGGGGEEPATSGATVADGPQSVQEVPEAVPPTPPKGKK